MGGMLILFLFPVSYSSTNEPYEYFNCTILSQRGACSKRTIGAEN